MTSGCRTPSRRTPRADRTAADAAPAGDGVTNLMKYATGLDPLKPCGSVTKVSVEEGVEGSRHLVLRWPVNPQAAEVKHEVEVSPDLVNWTSLGEVETAGKTSAEFRDAEPRAGQRHEAALPAA